MTKGGMKTIRSGIHGENDDLVSRATGDFGPRQLVVDEDSDAGGRDHPHFDDHDDVEPEEHDIMPERQWNEKDDCFRNAAIDKLIKE